MNPVAPVWAVIARTASESVPDRAWVAAAIFIPLLVLGLGMDILFLVRWCVRPVGWDRRAYRLARRPWAPGDAAGLGLALAAAFVLLGPVLRRVDDVGALLVQALILHGLVLGYLVVTLRRRRISLRRAFGMNVSRAARDIGAGLAAYLAAFPPVVLSALLGQWVLRAAGFSVSPQPVLALFAQDRPWPVRLMLLAVAVVLAPVMEEVVFRGVGQVAIARKWGMPAAVLAVSALFAALHGHVPTFAPLFVIGMAFSLAYLFTGSLTTAITLHVVFNGVNLVVLHWAG